MTIQNTDRFLVSRDGLNYKTEAQDLMAIQDTDLLLVERGGANYKVTGTEVKQYAQSSPDSFYSFFEYYTPPFLSETIPMQGNMQTGDDCICALTQDGIWRTTNGLNWVKVSTAKSRVWDINNSNWWGNNQGPAGLAYGGNGVWLAYGTPNLGSVKSTDDGLTWSPVTLPAPSTGFAGIAGRQNGPQSTFIIAPKGGVDLSNNPGISHYSLDGGLTWTVNNDFPVYAAPGGNNVTCSGIASATIEGQVVYGMVTKNSLYPGNSYTYLSTDFGASWDIFETTVSSPTGIGGGQGAFVFSAQVDYSTYYESYIYYIDDVAGPKKVISSPIFDNYANVSTNEASCTAMISGNGKILIQGYEGAAQFVEIGSTPQVSMTTQQSSAEDFGCAAVYFKGRFYYWDPYANRIFYSRATG